MVLVLLTLVVGVGVILLVGWWPGRIRHCRPAGWVAVGMSRIFVWLFHIKVVFQAQEKLASHHGFLFANHDSFVDIMVLLSLMPFRFLSMAEVHSYPLIGLIAAAIGTVFVQRADKNSRTEARSALVTSLRQEPHPPLVVFPEGKLAPGDEVLPFRFGAFALACENQIAFLPCALRYRPADLTPWAHGEGLALAVWRLAQAGQPLYAEVIPLSPVQPQPTDDPEQLAVTTRQAIAAAIGAS
jgi:1-acyl-sn-glycerol-3-phosphate acyltransferase